jgi:hypothetical protein
MAKTKNTFAEARKQTGQDQEAPPEKFEQATLPGVPAQTPKPVRGRQMMAAFVKPHFERTKDGDALIGLDFSFPLMSDHEGLLPKEVEDGWQTVIRKSCDKYRVNGVDPQTVRISLVPDDKHDLELVSADLKNIWLAHVQEKGAGKTKKVVRLSFRVVTERNKALRDFVWTNDGEFVWIELAETQGKLL